MSNETSIKVGYRVEYNTTGKTGDEEQGTVLEVSERKVRVQPDNDPNGDPVSIFRKYVTVIAKSGTKLPKAEKPKAEKAPKAEKTPKEPKEPRHRLSLEESRSITKGADLTKYVRGLGKTASGRPSFDIGDQIAELLRGLTVEDQIRVTAKKLTELTGETVTQTELQKKYGHLNAGQIRMNCGNRLRAAFRNAAAE